jgi:lipoic acid synthetase
VITAVNRDDRMMAAPRFAATIHAIRAVNPECRVEVLIPDFEGNDAALDTVLDAQPDVLNHNTEMVPRLYYRSTAARYRLTLRLLERAGRDGR